MKRSTAPSSSSNHRVAVASRRLVSRKRKPGGSSIAVGRVEFSADHFRVIAGPGQVESEQHLSRYAKLVREYGGRVLRARCFSPSNGPRSSRLSGPEAVDLLATVGHRYGLPTITEVASPEHVSRVATAVDAIQVAAHHMLNFELLEEIGRTDIAVILERSWSASVDEVLRSAECILAAGNQRVILCERGSKTFENRHTLDLGTVSLLCESTHLPVIVDPCQATDRTELVSPLVIASRALGAAGVTLSLDSTARPRQAPVSTALDETAYADLMSQLASSSPSH